MKSVIMLAALLAFSACRFPNPHPEPGEGEAEGECGECTTDADCVNGTCDTSACDDCDPATGIGCSGVCVPDGDDCGDGVCDPTDPNAAGTAGESCETCPEDCGDCGGQGCGGIAGIPCPPGYDCVDDPSDDCDPATGADCGGICVPADDCVCPTVWDPVCGADGVTYSNQCEAECAGAKVACGGECPCAPTCGDGVCDPNTAGTLGETCETCPQDCGDCCDPSSAEICGDGIDNDCDGAIDEDCPQGCGGIGGIPCPPGYDCVDDPSDDCDPATGVDCGGICVPAEDCVCPTQWDPVCGADGITYPNQCEADCAGAQVACGGECPCAPACGDGVCDAGDPGTLGESCETCPVDCGDCGEQGCGGFGGIPCPPGQECEDDPSDDCDPTAGGADCPGLCV